MKRLAAIVLVGLVLSCSGGKVTEPPVPSPTPTVEPTAPPTPEPSATPASCPPLVRWGARIHNIMDGGFNQVNQIRVGGIVVLDSTPFFQGGPKGMPCNDEHPNCGGRQCEDPRGGQWRRLEGGTDFKVQTPGPEYGFQIKIGGPEIGYLVEGRHVFQVCPPPGLVDALGQPVQILGNACETVVFEVLP